MAAADRSLDAPTLTLRHVGVFVFFWAVVHVIVVLLYYPEVLQGAQIDTDGYLRLVRVGLLLENGAWFDGSIPRSNWPFGEDHHWTRPLDVLIVGLAAPLIPLLGSGGALTVSGALVSPILHLVSCVAMVWVVRPLVPGPERFLAMPALLVQPGVIAYGTAGRADHHALILLLYILALGAWIRALLDPRHARPALAAGALSGVGLWVSPETLIPLAVLFLSGGVAWILDGERYAAVNLRLCVGLLMTVILSILLERPPQQWTAVEFDRISIAHVTMSVLALTFWWVVTRATANRGGLRTQGAAEAQGRADQRKRLVRAAGAALITLALMAAAHPRFFRGPWADVDPEIIAIWLDRVQELQPAFPRRLTDIGRFISTLGPAFLLLPVAVATVARGGRDPWRPIWVFLLLSFLVYVPLSAAQIRFSAFAGVIFAVLLVDLLRRVLPRLGEVDPPWMRRAARVGVMAGLLAGFLGLGLAVDQMTNRTAPRAGAGPADDDGRCDLRALARVLDDPAGPWSEPRTIAAFIDFGPELLYRTRHQVLAGPYHRNRDGILDTYRLLASETSGESRRIATKRDLDLILLCPPIDRAYFDRGGDNSLYHGLVDGATPTWLRKRDLPPPVERDFLLFELIRE